MFCDTKINAKPAVEGTIWMWHQDYNAWKARMLKLSDAERGDIQRDAERHDRV